MSSQFFHEKTDEEINELWQMAEDGRDKSKYTGMTYEEGIEAVLRWLFEGGDHPLKED